VQKMAPQLGELADTVRGDLVAAGKAAATAAVSNRGDALTDSIHDRAQHLRNPAATVAEGAEEAAEAGKTAARTGNRAATGTAKRADGTTRRLTGRGRGAESEADEAEVDEDYEPDDYEEEDGYEDDDRTDEADEAADDMPARRTTTRR